MDSENSPSQKYAVDNEQEATCRLGLTKCSSTNTKFTVKSMQQD